MKVQFSLAIQQEFAMGRPAGTWLFASMFFQGDGKEWSTEFWYKAGTSPKPANFDPNTLAVFFQSTFAASMEAILNTGIACVGSRIECNFGAGTFGGETHDDFTGNNLTTAMPEDVCAVVRKVTQTGGRSGSGRWRISGLCSDACTGSYLSAGGVTQLGDFATACLSSIADQGLTWTPQVYSPKLNTLTPITATQTDALLGTARRRRGRF